MKIENTKDKKGSTSLNVLIYGRGGVGKSTFASTFPKPLMLDFENGSKYFKERGIKIDVVDCKKWLSNEDKKELSEVLEKYESIIIDPIGEAMEKLIRSEDISGSKFRQSSGDLTISGWGEVKQQMRSFIKWLKDQGKNVVIIAHVQEKNDNDQLVMRPLIATKIGDELFNLVDVVGYLDVIHEGNEDLRVLFTDPSDNKKWSKDRTGKLPKRCEPTFEFLSNEIFGGKKPAKATKKDKVVEEIPVEDVEIPEKKEKVSKPKKTEEKPKSVKAEPDELD